MPSVSETAKAAEREAVIQYSNLRRRKRRTTLTGRELADLMRLTHLLSERKILGSEEPLS